MKTKKELKEEYKQMKIPMGVFQIKNISNNKVLIDNSIDMESKWGSVSSKLVKNETFIFTFKKDVQRSLFPKNYHITSCLL